VMEKLIFSITKTQTLSLRDIKKILFYIFFPVL
jgi:hypothetical protein